MPSFSSLNPVVVFIYFACAAGIVMFCGNPFLYAISLCGAVALFFVRNLFAGWRSHLGFLALFAVASLINPIFYHNGATVLFVVNDSPITFEAAVYGVASAAMLISVLYWFRSFSQIMTEDKLLYLTGAVSPRLSLILSMALRYVPFFTSQARKINQSQRALGLYKEDNALDSAKGGVRVFSILVTWALENGIITADSMAARGYGTGRRTSYSIYGFRPRDGFVLALILILLSLTITALYTGALDFEFYPTIQPAPLTPLSVVGYISYGLLALLPVIIEISENVKWKYLRSKI